MSPERARRPSQTESWRRRPPATTEMRGAARPLLAAVPEGGAIPASPLPEPFPRPVHLIGSHGNGDLQDIPSTAVKARRTWNRRGLPESSRKAFLWPKRTPEPAAGMITPTSRRPGAPAGPSPPGKGPSPAMVTALPPHGGDWTRVPRAPGIPGPLEEAPGPPEAGAGGRRPFCRRSSGMAAAPMATSWPIRRPAFSTTTMVPSSKDPMAWPCSSPGSRRTRSSFSCGSTAGFSACARSFRLITVMSGVGPASGGCSPS